jgi:hypothetical protein
VLRDICIESTLHLCKMLLEISVLLWRPVLGHQWPTHYTLDIIHISYGHIKPDRAQPLGHITVHKHDFFCKIDWHYTDPGLDLNQIEFIVDSQLHLAKLKEARTLFFSLRWRRFTVPG